MVTESVAGLLEGQGYCRDLGRGFWQKSGCPSIAYNDGDEVEERLARAVESVCDRSVDSPEWREHMIDWPSEYHFSHLRSNLLKAIPIKPGQRIVELGAGCGAITRWLGELGAEVIAVEGSARRAAVAVSRCRDLPNVQVVVQNLHELPPFAADWVILIGVLEYARLFCSGADPVRETLMASRNQLSEGGALILAIENQLGLKYFAGCNEEHLGTRFSGIQGLYRDDGPVTFGRRELGLQLAAAGFSAQKLYLPFPDYKLPTTIVDESAADDPNFDVAALVARSVARDYGFPALRSFSEIPVWHVLHRNGLVADLANSFLVVASQTAAALAERTPRSECLAWNYSVNRRPPLAVTTRIVRDGSSVRVEKFSVARGASPIESERWRHSIEPAVDYIVGEILSLRMIRSAAAEDQEKFFADALVWVDLLLERSSVADKGCDRGAAGAWLADGSALDLIPGNIIIDPSGSPRYFDLEWQSIEPIPLAWIVLRGLLMLSPQAMQGSIFRARSAVDVAGELLRRRGLALHECDVRAAREHEAEFQAWVQGTTAEATRWDEHTLNAPGWGSIPNVVDLLQSSSDREVSLQVEFENLARLATQSQHELREAHVALRGVQEALSGARAHYEWELSELRREAGRLHAVCEAQGAKIANIERHPLIGTALRSRRRLRNMVHRLRSHAAFH